VKGIIPKEVKMKEVEIWFQDEARFGQQNSISRVWSGKGIRPRLIRQQQYEYLYVFGAVCSERKEAVGLMMPLVNSDAMEHHLKEISKRISKGKHGVIILDRAGWHRSRRLEIPKNISLLMLPAYSPELNPVEQVWNYLRQRYLSNRAFKNYEEIESSCIKAWNNFADNSDLIQSIAHRQWASLSNTNSA